MNDENITEYAGEPFRITSLCQRSTDGFRIY